MESASFCHECACPVPPRECAAQPSNEGQERGRIAQGKKQKKVTLACLLAALIIIAIFAVSRSRPFEPVITMAKFEQLYTGMSYREAVEIIGAEGEEMSRSDLAGYTTVMYMWKNPGGSNMNVMFQNGGLVMKAQFGLE